MKYISKLGAWLSVLPILFLPMKASAQLSAATDYLSGVGDETGQTAGEDALPTMIGQIINILLSVLGIVFLVMVIYAGFLWMGAQDDAKKTEKAKKLLINGIIGMVIIIAAYAISSFVITALTGITG
jgi:heme/copper-type cytochrome/quinol oxidase subunit 2